MSERRADSDEASLALQLAIERGEIELAYQPKLSLLTGELAGVEALSRWPGGPPGWNDPSDFVPLAERDGLIDALTDLGIRRALKQWVIWRDQGLEIGIAFNISALTLRDVSFPDILQRLCQLEGVPCEQLILELTEGATQHVVRLMDTLTRFRLKGMGAALDDFGTGYSSLVQLRQLPFTELKVDRLFVSEATRSQDSRLIVKSIIDLAHGLGLTVTAEGVEDDETFDLLRELGCDQVQGFLVAKALAPEKLAPWILQHAAHWRTRCGR